MLKNVTLALGVLTVGVVMLACGSSSSPDTPAAGSGGAGGGGGGSAGNKCASCINPPEPTAGAPAGDGAGVVFAVKSLDIGGNGDPTSQHWKSLGYDLDGQVSAANSAVHCKLQGDAPDATKTDGNGGIDNSFGAHVLPALPTSTNGQPVESVTNDSITQGKFTLLFKVDGLNDKKDLSGIPASLFAAGGLKSADDAGTTAYPKWDGSDAWPVACELLQTCLASGTPAAPDNKSKIVFDSGYVAGGVWVSGAKTHIPISIALGSIHLTLNIHKAVITGTLGTETPVPQSMSGGMIAGILDTEEIITALDKMAGSIRPEFCTGTTLDELKNTIRQASDIMTDGTQDASKTCNGISVGMGFTASAAKIGSTLDQAPAIADPCADAGK